MWKFLQGSIAALCLIFILGIDSTPWPTVNSSTSVGGGFDDAGALVSSTTSTDDFGIGVTATADQKLLIRSDADAQEPLVIEGNSATQSGNLLEIYKNNGGTLVFSVDANGQVTIAATTDGQLMQLSEDTDHAGDTHTWALDLSTTDLTASVAFVPNAAGRLPLGILQTFSECLVVDDPAAEQFLAAFRKPVAWTVTEVWCETNTGTADINFQNDDGTAANIMASDLQCTTSEASQTSFSGTEDQVAADDELEFEIAAVASSPAKLSVCVEYTYD